MSNSKGKASALKPSFVFQQVPSIYCLLIMEKLNPTPAAINQQQSFLESKTSTSDLQISLSHSQGLFSICLLHNA